MGSRSAAGVFCSAIAAFLPGVIGCGATGMKRSASDFALGKAITRQCRYQIPYPLGLGGPSPNLPSVEALPIGTECQAHEVALM